MVEWTLTRERKTGQETEKKFDTQQSHGVMAWHITITGPDDLDRPPFQGDADEQRERSEKNEFNHNVTRILKEGENLKIGRLEKE